MLWVAWRCWQFVLPISVVAGNCVAGNVVAGNVVADNGIADNGYGAINWCWNLVLMVIGTGRCRIGFCTAIVAADICLVLIICWCNADCH
jgi:hypothetical protein